MRLLNIKALQFEVYREKADRPKYIILSHRWTSHETTFQELQLQLGHRRIQDAKVAAFVDYVGRTYPDIHYIWIDTACIDRTNSTELGEAINSMFRWYRDAELCLAYLQDVNGTQSLDDLSRSAWFDRGWTLQELLAPSLVIFLSSTWSVLGYKGTTTSSAFIAAITGPNLESFLSVRTSIPVHVLHNYNIGKGIHYRERMKWMVGRTTTVQEELVYALIGICDVALRKQIGNGKLVRWLNAPDPQLNHERARRHYEPETGTWLLNLADYKDWRSGDAARCLWLTGRVGCGKTILCSTVIEDVEIHCERNEDVGCAYFYFSYTEDAKQTHDGLLSSAITQLGSKQPGLSALRRAFSAWGGRKPGREELRTILLACLSSYKIVYLMIDALDECVLDNGYRLSEVQYLKQLILQAPNVRMFAITRDTSEIRDCMYELNATAVTIENEPGRLRADIEQYVRSQTAEENRLKRLPSDLQELVYDTITEKAKGMFRWVYHQLREISGFRSTNRDQIIRALSDLPANLDETYARILNSIIERDFEQARMWLRWIAYAARPIRLSELTQTCLLRPQEGEDDKYEIDYTNAGHWRDPLEVLAGLIDRVSSYRNKSTEAEPSDVVILAHFSVKEYLQSSRLAQSSLNRFHFNPGYENWFIAQSCLIYLEDYSASNEKVCNLPDLLDFPLLLYAARHWPLHSAQSSGSLAREMNLLKNDKAISDWVMVSHPDDRYGRPFRSRSYSAPGIYYATSLKIPRLIELYVQHQQPLDLYGGRYGTPLQVACYWGDQAIVRMLLKGGANVNAAAGPEGTALQCACYRGNAEVVHMLLVHGADVNARGDVTDGITLANTSRPGYTRIVERLGQEGVDVNARVDLHRTALSLAAHGNYVKFADFLIDRDADVNLAEDESHSPLYVAIVRGNWSSARLLLNHGADPEARWKVHAWDILESSEQDLKLPLFKVLGIDAIQPEERTPLQIACRDSPPSVVKLLLDAGASVNERSRALAPAHRRACMNKETGVVKLLLERGADVHTVYQSDETAICVALCHSHNDATVKLLLQYGAVLDFDNASFHEAYWRLSRYHCDGCARISQLVHLPMMEWVARKS